MSVPAAQCSKTLQVGEAFAGNDKVLIAKMDATANDVPSNLFKVQVCARLPLMGNAAHTSLAWATMQLHVSRFL